MRIPQPLHRAGVDEIRVPPDKLPERFLGTGFYELPQVGVVIHSLAPFTR
jgi:hypothetical protein